MQICDAPDATGHLFPPFSCASMSAGSGGEETRPSGRERDHKRGGGSYNIPLYVEIRRRRGEECLSDQIFRQMDVGLLVHGLNMFLAGVTADGDQQKSPRFVGTIFYGI